MNKLYVEFVVMVIAISGGSLLVAKLFSGELSVSTVYSLTVVSTLAAGRWLITAIEKKYAEDAK